MNTYTLLKFITGHPLNKGRELKAISRFVKWQINCRLNPHPVIYQFTPKSKLIVQRGMTGATGNIYCGLHEFHDMAFVIHFLRPTDFFVDIGANVGSYTVLASAHVGSTSYSFEPAPSTFDKLRNNIHVNALHDKVTAFNAAVGASDGTINFTTNLDTMNHVAVGDEASIAVPVKALDDLLATAASPALIKIDVEGFETEVLKGAGQTLRNPELKGIIIELNGSGNRYGYNEQDIHENLLSLGFRPFLYSPMKRELVSLETPGTHNTLYLRDYEFVMNRLKTAPKLSILGKEF